MSLMHVRSVVTDAGIVVNNSWDGIPGINNNNDDKL